MAHIRANFEGAAIVPYARNLPELAQVQEVQLLGEDRFKSDSNWFVFDLVKRTAQLPGRIFRGVDNFEVAIPVKMFNCIWNKLNKVEEANGSTIHPVLKAIVAGLPALPLVVLSILFFAFIRLPITASVFLWCLPCIILDSMRSGILWIASKFQGDSSSKVDGVAQKQLGTKSSAQEAVNKYYDAVRQSFAEPEKFLARDTLLRNAFQELKSHNNFAEIQAQIAADWKANAAIMNNSGYADLNAEEIMDYLEDFPACEAAQALAFPGNTNFEGTIEDPATTPKDASPSEETIVDPAAIAKKTSLDQFEGSSAFNRSVALDMNSKEFLAQALALQEQRSKLVRNIKNAEDDLAITQGLFNACFKEPIWTGTPDIGHNGTIASRLAPRAGGYFQPVIAEFEENARTLAPAIAIKTANLEGLRKQLAAIEEPETLPRLTNLAMDVYVEPTRERSGYTLASSSAQAVAPGLGLESQSVATSSSRTEGRAPNAAESIAINWYKQVVAKPIGDRDVFEQFDQLYMYTDVMSVLVQDYIVMNPDCEFPFQTILTNIRNNPKIMENWESAYMKKRVVL